MIVIVIKGQSFKGVSPITLMVLIQIRLKFKKGVAMKELKYSKAKQILGVDSIHKHPLYFTLRSMIQRCHRPKCKSYEFYGAKGISVCERWLEPYGMGLANFYLDMGLRPSELHSLDRIDFKGDYSPENCRWATPETQSRNRGLHKNNTSGHVGVRYCETKGYARWRAVWQAIDGTPKRKTFSVNKYGYDQALKLVIEYRDLMIKELNERGAGYTEHHGK